MVLRSRWPGWNQMSQPCGGGHPWGGALGAERGGIDQSCPHRCSIGGHLPSGNRPARRGEEAPDSDPRQEPDLRPRSGRRSNRLSVRPDTYSPDLCSPIRTSTVPVCTAIRTRIGPAWPHCSAVRERWAASAAATTSSSRWCWARPTHSCTVERLTPAARATWRNARPRRTAATSSRRQVSRALFEP